MSTKKILILLFPIWLLIALSACRKDKFIEEAGAKLELSTDSVVFDTVFTAIGSTTKSMIVHNRNNQPIRISSLKLAKGNGSNYRLNVDGVPGKVFTDVEIGAKDSIFIFIEVTIDPNSANTPYIVEDEIQFVTNGNAQQVKLAAWGQNAYFHYNDTGQPFNLYGFSCSSCFPICNEIWQTDKPHIVFGYAVVDSACTLEIPDGAIVYFYTNSGLLVYKQGTLRVEGTDQNPVKMEGFRREMSYRDVPGQWDRIWLMPESRNNVIRHARIRNGNIGIQADTVGSTSPTLVLEHSVIENMSTAAIYAQGARIVVRNSLLVNAGQYIAALTLGGDYTFEHSTLANFWNYSNRQTPALVLNNYYTDINNVVQLRNLVKADFKNSIIHGNLNNEIGFDLNSGAQKNFLFDHSILKIDGSINTTTSNYNQIIKNINPKFINPSGGNYQLDSLSQARNTGDPAIVIPGGPLQYDLKGTDRLIHLPPDRGCYERVD